MLRIGITGGIGSGKTACAHFFKNKGAEVFEADVVAKEGLSEPEVIASLVAAFGKDILANNDTINNSALAARAFTSTENQQRLNSITHPLLVEKLKTAMHLAESQGIALFVFDAALLFEQGWDQYMDITVAIMANEATRIARMMRKRPDLTKKQILARMKLQFSEEEKARRADFVITNNGTGTDLNLAAENLYRSLNL